MVITRLAEAAQLPNSAGTLYANESGTKTWVKEIILFNANTTAEVVRLYNVPDSAGSAGTAAAANQFFERTLATLETVIISFAVGLVLEDHNDTIQGYTTTASKVTYMIMGATE